VYTKTWFHTGAYIRRDTISTHYETEYYQKDPDAWLLADTVLPPGLTAEEEREACRALKGSMLRQEVYAEDGTDRAEHPYTVTEANYSVQCLQQRGDNRHAVFLVTPSENLAYHYEREFTLPLEGDELELDPRIAHTLNLITDRYGNSTHALSIVYPRRGTGHPAEQQRLYATLTESQLLHPDNHADWYRHSLPVASRSFELHGLDTLFTGEKFALHGEAGLKALVGTFFKTTETGYVYPPEIDPAQVLDHSATHDPGTVQLRLLAASRIKYLSNDLTTVLPFGQVEHLESLAIPYEAYTLAFTQPILEQPELEGKITPTLLRAGGYRTSDELFQENEAKWWIPAGQTLFFYPSEAPTDRTAAGRFYLPVGERTPLGQESYVWYDHHEPQAADSYWLFVEKATDPLGNTLRMLDFDYRILQARAMEDSNGNRSEAAFDIRGMVIASAVLGKGEEGDELADFLELNCNPTTGYFADILYPETDENGRPQYPIGRATTWFHYDVFAWQREQQPPYAIGLTRELHYHQPGGNDSPIQRVVTYSDGFGREILSKVEAEDGPAPHYDAEGQLVLAADGTPDLEPCTDRWVGNGRTIFNNKGKPVQQYEPFFDSNAHFTSEEALVYLGVTPTIHYDPLTRVIRTDLPDGTFSKVEFTPWEQTTWDPNDTVKDGDWYHDRIDGQLGPQAERAARQTELHYETPTTIHLDTLGRPFVSIAHNRYRAHYKDPDSEVEIYIPTHTFLDIEGNPLDIWDGRRSERLDDPDDAIAYNCRGQAPSEDTGNRVMTYVYAMGGLQLFQNSMDAGRRWALFDVLGNSIYGWDERGHTLHTTYDALQRPTHLWVTQEEQPRLVEYLIYGEEIPDATAHNLRGQLYLHFDGAGLARSESFDFKGNPIAGSRFLTQAYQQVPDWITVSEIDLPTLLTELANLEQEAPTDLATWLDRKAYTTTARFDALGRPVRSAGPDGSVQYPLYNKANLLEMVRVNVRGEAEVDDETETGIRTHPKLTTFVENIDYDAKGQRECIAYGNGSNTRYTYDAETFRLIHLKTTRSNQGPDGALRDTGLQDIRYTYDPVGNITEIYDAAQPTIFTDNQRVEPRHGYTYDALYQLICATGRESRRTPSSHPGHAEIPLLENIPIADSEVRNYRQHYRYDAAGNIMEMRHVARGGRWTRTYRYEDGNNRLLKAYKGAESPADPEFEYDAHGSMTTMPHLHTLYWDYKDQLVQVQKTENGAGEVFCQYDSQRQRVRKVFVQDEDERQTVKERIYLGGYEIYRVDGVVELETLHVMDDTQRIAMIETPTGEAYRYRYQLANHLGSASVELDSTAEVITYEEYHPYGTSSFRARKSGVEVSPKRYRYTGMERDEETGLSYHTARYYLPWLGRWGSCDPKSIESNINLFNSLLNNPIKHIDPLGTQDMLTWAENKLKRIQKYKQKGGQSWGWSMTVNEQQKFSRLEKKPGIASIKFQQMVMKREEQELKLIYDILDIPYEKKARKLEPYNYQNWAWYDKFLYHWKEAPPEKKAEMALTAVGGACSAGGGYVGDYGSLITSAGVFVINPTWDTAGDLGLDTLGALLPGMAAAGTMRRADRLADFGDTVHDMDKASDFGDVPSGLPTRGSNLGQTQGRDNRIDWLETNEFDPNQPKHVRGWLENERRRVSGSGGGGDTPRNPPGYVMGHKSDTPAREGYDYSNANLTNTDLNNLEERAARKLKYRR
jgi:RHS repeat-associated protein